MTNAIKIYKKYAEEVRKFLIKNNLMDFSHLPSSEGDFLFFPIKRLSKTKDKKAEKDKLKILEEKFNAKFEKRRMKRKKIEKLILPPFDLIGDVAIFELPKEFKDLNDEQKEKEAMKLAKNIMKKHKNIKTVAMKTGGVSGPFRIRKFKILITNKLIKEATITVHKEHGCRFKLDVAGAYYSPRLSYERKRINSLVKDGETVFVPFAGVGPFAIIIAKNHPNSKVYANELNPEAVKYLIENIKLNKVYNVIPIPGDARDLKRPEFKEIADRVVMPLPMSADEFLDVSFFLAKKNGIVHFYYFTDSLETAEKVVKAAAEREGKKIKIIESRLVRDYSKDIIEVVVDFKVLE